MNVTRVTLFEISPMVDSENITGDKPQKCTRGHTWNFGFHFVGVSLDMGVMGATNGREEFCFFCIRDMLREKCGKVKDA